MNHSEEDAHSRVEMIHQDVASDFDAYPEEGFAVTDEIDGKSFWMRSRNRLFSRQLQDLTSNRPDSKFLEVGCGNGSFLRYVSDKTSADITGSEVYVPGVLATQAKVSGIRLMQLDATRMPFSDVYDVVAAFDVLEHIDEDEKAIAGIHKALKPGGAFMVSVPQYQWMWSDLDEIVKHRRRYGRSELVEKLQTAGFDVSYVTSHVFILFPLMAASRLLTNILKKKAESTREHTQFSDISNAICDALMRIDEFLIARNFSLPFGGTLYAVARKKHP